MSNSALQEKVYKVMNALTRTGEFRDIIEIVKELLCLIYISSRSNLNLEKYHDDIYTLRNEIPGSKVDPFTKNIFYEDVLMLSGAAMLHLIEALRSFDISDKVKRSELADSIISFAIEHTGKSSGQFLINNNLARLIAFLAWERGMDDVVDPFAGIVSYAVTPEFSGIKFRGREYSLDATVISNLLLAIHGREQSVEEMSMADKWEYPENAENLITVPPFNFPTKELYSDISCRSKYAHELIVESFIENPSSKKAIILLPSSFAYSQNSEWLRKELLNRNYIDKVISLPSGVLNGTQITSLIIVLDKTRADWDEEDITFISLVDCARNMSRGRSELNLEYAKNLILSRSGKYAKDVTIDEILNLISTDINPGKYIVGNLLPEISADAHIAPLSTFLQPIELQSQRVKSGETKDIVGLKDLSDIYDFVVIGKPSSKTTSRYVELSEDAIILTISSGKFHVGRFKYKGTPIGLSINLVAFATECIGDMDYILLELSKPYISKQLELLGVANQPVSDYVLHNLRIVCENLPRQKEIVLEAQKQIVSELHIGLSDAHTDYRKDVHIKKHAIGQTVGSIGNWWTLLEEARGKGNLINESVIIGDSEISLGAVLDNLRNCFGRLSVQIDKFDRGYNAMSVIINLDEFINEYIGTHSSPIFKYEIVDDENSKPEGETESKKLRTIFFPKDVLAMIMNNVISNACAHGFDNTMSSSNLVRIAVEVSGGVIILSISNNGKPAPSDMSAEKIMTYGESSDLRSHCGIGGYETRQLMNDFGGEVDIILDKDAEFPVKYQLTFKSVDNE